MQDLIDLHKWAIKIEHILVPALRPYFLSIIVEDNPASLHVIVSSKQFDKLSVNERIQRVLDLITSNGSATLEGNIVIEPFSAFELEEILDHL